MLGGLGGPFDEYSLREGSAGSDERDEVLIVDRPPAVLGGFEQLEHHRQPGGPDPGPLVTFVRCRTVTKVDSGLVILR
jgi:hypothetical protein